jgi:hypothetical protein
LSRVRESHAVAVTLEELSSIATVTVSLIAAGLLAAEDVPWIVSLHDLEIISELIDRPAEFVLYLRRRTEPTVTVRYHAVDELDLFLEFFSTGLYVEPDPEKVREVLPHLGEPSVAETRRFKAQGLEMLTSRTDQLDAWYLHKLGIRRTPAPKPSHNTNPAVRDLVDSLSRRGEAGWLSVGATLLGGSSTLQRKVARAPAGLARLTRRDGRAHSYTMFVGGSGHDSTLLVWTTLDDGETERAAEADLRSYLTAKKHQMKAAVAVCFVFGPEDPTTPVMVIYESNPPGPDPDLDRIVADSSLRPIKRSVDRMPPPRR